MQKSRERMKSQFMLALASHEAWSDVPDADREAIIRRMERGCYNEAIATCTRDGIDRLWTEIKFVSRYSAMCYKILSNLDKGLSGGSEHLFNMIIKDGFNPEKFATLTSDELNPEASRAEREEIEARMNVKINLKVSRSYYCNKCGKSETTVRSYQSRSADEDNTLSIKCIHCGHVWRKN